MQPTPPQHQPGRWITAETRDDPDALRAISDEIGDVMIYLVQLADALGIDPLERANAKIDRNDHRFPLVRPT
jgi:NTP pyrophosphatase (non-canonical NTP hydrolase)